MTSKKSLRDKENFKLSSYDCPLCGGDLRWEVDQWVCNECNGVITKGRKHNRRLDNGR